MNKNKKSQVVVYDFLIAFTIFTVIIVASTLFWFRTSAQVENDFILEDKLVKARQISYLLAKTPGIPERWELDFQTHCVDQNCSLGLARTSNELTQAKLDGLKSLVEYELSSNDDLGYNFTKQHFRIETYDFRIVLRDISKTIIYDIGKDPNENLSVNIRRSVILNNTKYNLEVSVY